MFVTCARWQKCHSAPSKPPSGQQKATNCPGRHFARATKRIQIMNHNSAPLFDLNLRETFCHCRCLLFAVVTTTTTTATNSQLFVVAQVSNCTPTNIDGKYCHASLRRSLGSLYMRDPETSKGQRAQPPSDTLLSISLRAHQRNLVAPNAT